MLDTFTVPVFFYAVTRGAYRDVRSALGRHPDLVFVKNEGATALHFAAVENQKQIADILQISIMTVEFHKSKIMQRLDLQSTAELIRYAVTHGILVIESQ